MPPKKEKGKKRKELPTAFLPDTPAWPTSEGTQPPAPRPAPPAPPRNSGAPILVRTAGGRTATVIEKKQRGWFVCDLDGNANEEGKAHERKTLRRPHGFAPGQDHLLDSAPQAPIVPKPWKKTDGAAGVAPDGAAAVAPDRAAGVAPVPEAAPKFWGVSTGGGPSAPYSARYFDASDERVSIGNFATPEEAALAVNAAIEALPPDVQERRHLNQVVNGKPVPKSFYSYKKKSYAPVTHQKPRKAKAPVKKPTVTKAAGRPTRDRARDRVLRRVPLTLQDVDSLNWDEACEYAKAMGVSKKSHKTRKAYRDACRTWFVGREGDVFVPAETPAEARQRWQRALPDDVRDAASAADSDSN